MLSLRYLILSSLLLLSVAATAQEVIKGIVMDSATFSPLPYVNVRVKNQSRGTTSDDQGNFSLVSFRSDTLVFTFIGYQDVVVPLTDWEPSIIRMSEKRTMLSPVLIRSTAINPYEGLFDDQNALLKKKKIPFYYARYRKEKIKVGWLLAENKRVQNYVDLMIKDDQMKLRLMKAYSLSEDRFYQILARFNEENVDVMYYITIAELTSLMDNFFRRESLQSNH